jgi:hypothetical protein
MKGRQPKSDQELNEWLATDEGKQATMFEPTLMSRWGRNGTCLNGPICLKDDAWHSQVGERGCRVMIRIWNNHHMVHHALSSIQALADPLS